jgi:hypothetical protein
MTNPMALIPCTACDNQISEMAAACPKCGHPTDTDSPATSDGLPPARVVTVEQTSKKYKAGQLVGGAMVCASAVACTASEPGTSAILLVLGMVVYLGSRFGAWWNNG